MRIIFVAGILSMSWFDNGWKKDLQEAFPDAEVLGVEDFYLHLQSTKIEQATQKLTKLLEEDKETILVAHSFGGILSRAALRRAGNSSVQLFCSMASPHTMPYGFVPTAKKKIHCPSLDALTCPTLSFGGLLDIVVPAPFTTLDTAHHINLWSCHLSFLFSKGIRKRVITAMMERLSSHQSVL